MPEAKEPIAAERVPWYGHLPIVCILGWWLYDLQFQWRAMVDYQFGWLVLLLSGYLAWERWPSRPRLGAPGSVWICGLLAVVGVPFVLLAELYKNAVAMSPAASFSLSVGCSLFLSALMLHTYGRATFRHFLFPLLFLFVAVPLPKVFWNPIVLGLQEMITWLDVAALRLLGIAAWPQANVIRLSNCVVGIDEACSGIRSLQSSIMAALFIGNLTLKRTGFQVFFCLGGVLLAITGNFFRSLYLALTAQHHGIEALKGVHDTAGWSILVFTAGGLVVLAWFMARWEKALTRALAAGKESSSSN
jgi:exosortase